jgi:PAS domain-containing protein
VRVSYDGETYVLETNRDITARKQAEEELRKSKERLRSSLFHSPLPILLFDDRERILALGQSWLEQTGYSSEDLSASRTGRLALTSSARVRCLSISARSFWQNLARARPKG